MITIDNIYLGYTYRGQIKLPHGRIEIDTDLPFTTTQFYEDKTNKRHCKMARKPYSMYYGKVWGNDREQVKAMIVARYKERIKELETSNSLAYAEMIVSEREEK